MIKSSYHVDRALFNFLFNSFEILYLVIACFGHKDIKYTIEERDHVKSLDSSSSDF